MSHAKKLLLFCSQRVSSEYKVITWSGMAWTRWMITHQVKVFKLSNWFSFMSCFQVDAKDRSQLGLSSKTKKEQALCPDLQASTTLTNQCKTTHNRNRQRQQCSHSNDAGSTKFRDQHQQTRRGRVYVRGLKLCSLLSPNSQPWTCKRRAQRQWLLPLDPPCFWDWYKVPWLLSCTVSTCLTKLDENCTGKSNGDSWKLLCM